jgi:protein gp37
VAETSIEWATHVWNPVTGCTQVSPGCAHCYALTYAGRLKAMGQPKYQRDGGRGSGPGFGVTLHEGELAAPSRWRKPRRVFVNSMSDLFHEDVPFDFVARVLDAIADAEQHTFMILTKRPERALDFFESERAGEGWYAFPDNVWMGVTIENRRFVQRADILRDIPANTRFISAEPLLGPLLNELGFPERGGRAWRWEDGYVGPSLNLESIDWLIVGGESGPEHRPVDEYWVSELRDECLALQERRCERCDGEGTRPGYMGHPMQCLWCGGAGKGPGPAFFFKQWGGHTTKAGGRELDGRTWDELPTKGIELVRRMALAGVTTEEVHDDGT